MKPIVFIIVRCTKLVNKRAATLVFNTIRVGFPTFNIICAYLGDFLEVRQEIETKCHELGILFRFIPQFKTNDEVIANQVEASKNDDSFIFCDSDIIFWRSMEDYTPKETIAGAFIPKHFNRFTNCLNVARLHTSLFYVASTRALKQQMQQSFNPHCDKRFTPVNFFRPTVVFEAGAPILYDSCANLYQAIGGESFPNSILDCYTHLHCGSYVDETTETIPGLDKIHCKAFENPESVREILKLENCLPKN